MQISIHDFQAFPKPSHKLALYFYLVDFSSREVQGKARLYTPKKPNELLQTQEISVEVEFDAIQNLTFSDFTDQTGFQFIPLDSETDYWVNGQVESVFEENEGVACHGFIVTTLDAKFWIPDVEISYPSVTIGQWVQFTVIGLTLWDVNY